MNNVQQDILYCLERFENYSYAKHFSRRLLQSFVFQCFYLLYNLRYRYKLNF